MEISCICKNWNTKIRVGTILLDRFTGSTYFLFCHYNTAQLGRRRTRLLWTWHHYLNEHDTRGMVCNRQKCFVMTISHCKNPPQLFSSAVPPGSGAFQMPTRPSSASAASSTLRGGRANLRNASVTFSLF